MPLRPPRHCTARTSRAIVLLIFLILGFGNVVSAQTAGEWGWMSGCGTLDCVGQADYGTLGVPAPGNVPGRRSETQSWTDSTGNLWLFGGYGVDSNGTWGVLNDLWEFNPTTGLWAWMSGTSTLVLCGGQFCVPSAVYGTLGVPAPGNTPSIATSAPTWTDKSGNFWLYGDDDSNNIWQFSPSTNLWAWMGGSGTDDQIAPAYGTLGVPSSLNTPGLRGGTANWIDSGGNFWLFGGTSRFSNGNWASLNDLWEFNPPTGLWTWMGGSTTAPDQSCDAGVYGTLRKPFSANVPGGRSPAASWTDSGGHLWLFGGNGCGASVPAVLPELNDVWEYDPSTNEWTWMSGSKSGNQAGTYGTLGISAAANAPGARCCSVSWMDGDGKLWLFGGIGFDANHNSGNLNDLWEFNPSTNEWTWISGGSTVPGYGGDPAVYGTLGEPAAENVPGGRAQASGWTDGEGNLWFFGGSGSHPGYNDLWEFQFTRIAATPTFNPTAGTYNTPQTVTISDGTPGTTIYCTTNGTKPTTSSSQCGGPITVSSTETIQAIAVASGYSQSAVGVAKYTLVAATPTFTIPGGTYTSARLVTLQDATPGATIYYTINGSTPTTSSTKYTAAIPINSTETIKAIAVEKGYTNSEVGSAKYVLTLVALAPVFSPPGGTYASKQSVKLSDTTKGATIYYTTNGKAPTTKSTNYTKPITVATTETIEAIAVAKGFSNSATSTARYTIAP